MLCKKIEPSSLTIQFNKLLQEELKKNNKLDDDICLITKEPLEETFIKLSCNHTFNYDAIYKEVFKQKIIKNYKEIQKLKNNCIKCPYCRNVQDKLLPHKPGTKKTKLVNWPPKVSMENPYIKNYCKYIFKNGKRKNSFCNIKCVNELCNKHLKYIERKKLKKSLKNNKNKIVENEIIEKETFNIPKLKYACKNGVYSYFETTCDHCYQRGKNKGKKCNEIILVMIATKGIIKKKRICNKHKNLKMYKNIQYENVEPDEFPILLDPTVLNENTQYLNTNENIKEFIKKNYTYYYNNENYMLKGVDYNDLTKLKFVKIIKV
tara:strand:- start:11009 stop:11968 length:960 start_codon:yes stop_codon:yes gene_type:complete